MNQKKIHIRMPLETKDFKPAATTNQHITEVKRQYQSEEKVYVAVQRKFSVQIIYRRS